MKIVFIDLWGTLLQNPEYHPIEKIITTLKLNISHDELIQQCDKYGLFTQTIDSLQIWKTILTNNTQAEQANTIWLHANRESSLFPQTKEFLQAIKNKGYKLVLASAIDKSSFDIIDRMYNLQQYFDAIKTTFDVGHHKSLAYYKALQELFHCNPKDTCMIGDSIHYDIIPADDAGFQTILLARYHLTEEDKNKLPKKTILCNSYNETLEKI
jgi:FMN phosphatase YigB (HAD superfamily)